MEPESGIKVLSLENWLEPDEASMSFSVLDQNYRFRSLLGEDYEQGFLIPKLATTVPSEVRTLFEVARGTMLYGYFFYPLYGLGEQHLYRVAEAAVAWKCKGAGIDPIPKRFVERVDSLRRLGALSEERAVWWHQTRQLRNVVLHATYQGISMPSDARRSLHLFADRLNELFG
jgi:hypothetical protein